MLIFNYGEYSSWEEQWKISIDPENKLFIIRSGITSIDVQVDLYSVWKRWVKLYDNAKWLAAFRTFGGDPTSESQFAPRYFFLINNWKVCAQDVLVVVQTNLYSDDGLSPFIIENAAVTNRTSDVPVVKSDIEERLDYGDRVYYDETSPYSGIDYPIGTIAEPVNNMTDAIALANLYNISDFYCLSDVTFPGNIGQTFEGYSYYADRENLTISPINDNIFINTDWHGFTIDLNFSGGYGNQLEKCIVNRAINMSGQIVACQIGSKEFRGTVKVEDEIVMSACYSGVAGAGTPLYDMHDGKDTKLSIRSYSGGVEIINANTSGDTATVELIAGQIRLNSSCTDGYLDLRGVGYITHNEGTGCTVKTTGFVDSFETYIEETKILDEQLAYQNTLYYDPINGVTGTTYPVGTSAVPSNNIPQLYYLSEYATKIKNIRIRQHLTVSGITSSLPPGQKMDYFTITADAPGVNLSIFDDGLIENVKIENFNILEVHLGGLYNEFFMCNLHEIYGAAGSFANCSIFGPHYHGEIFYDHKFRVQENTTLISCYPGEAGSPPTIWMVNTGGTDLSIRDWNGDLIIDKVEHVDDHIVVEVVAGKIILTSGCTKGIIDLRGVGYIENNAGTGCTIITTGFVDSFETYIEETRSIDEQLAYSGNIYYDSINGFTGSTYPIGTVAKPSNNIFDLFILTQNLNIKNIISESDFIVSGFTGLAIKYTIKSNQSGNNFYMYCGNNVENLTIIGFNIIGDFKGVSHNFINCSVIDNVYGLSGEFENNDIDGELHIENNTTFSNCHPDIAGGAGHIYMSNSGGTKVAFRDYSGSLNFEDVTHSFDKISIDLNAGHITFGSGCTNGIADVRGVGYITDNSLSGFTTILDGFIQATPGEYDTEIVIDSINGSAGIIYPIGTNSYPVNNIDDALILLSNYQLNKIRIIGSLTISDKDLNGIAFTAQRSTGNILTINNSVTNFTYFSDLTLFVQQSGSCRYTTSVLVDIDDFDGGAKDCLLIGDINITGDGSNYLTNCDTYTTDINNTVAIDINNKKLNIIRCRGYYNIINKIGTDTTTIDLVGGILQVDSGCTNGTIYISGIAEVIDNSSSGCTVINNALSNKESASAVWDEQITDHTQVGSTGDALYNVSAGATPEVIAEAVWNQQMSGFTTPGSAGQSLTYLVDVIDGLATLSGISEEISGLTSKLDLVSADVKRILGLTQENFLIKDHVYDTNDLLQSATIKIFNNASDTSSDTNPLAEYTMSALYDSSGKLTNYKVIKL